MGLQSGPTRPAEPAPAASPYRWYALAILFLVSILNTIDKSLIPALAEPIKLEFDLSDSQLGLLIGLVFSVAYAIASIPIGLLIDRVNRARMLGILLITWSGLTLLSAKAGSFMSLALCRMGVAAAESGGNPTSLALISDYFPKEERGRAVSIFSINSAIASLVVFSAAGYIAAEYGWRTAFVVAAIPGLILGAIVFLTLREPVRGAFDPPSQNPTDEKHASLIDILKSIAANKPLLWVAAAAVLAVLGQAGGGAFTAAFFVRIHGLSLIHAGVVTGVLAASAFAIGTIVGGIVADRQGKKTPGGGCRFLCLMLLAAVPFGFAGFIVPSVTASVALLFVYKMLAGSFYGATLSIIMNLSPIKMRGATMAYITIIMNLGGYGFGPQVAGVFSDLFKLAGAAEPLRWGLVAVSSVFLLSALCYYQAARRMDRQSAAI